MMCQQVRDSFRNETTNQRRIHAKDRSRGVRDAFLLAKRKENKLSTSYESEAYIVTGRHGDQVVMSPSQGVVLSH